jgi:hypothetical protein
LGAIRRRCILEVGSDNALEDGHDSDDDRKRPSPVARFVAIGLFLMAFFTTLWALWALYGLPTVAAVVLVAIFVALSVVFVINGVQLIKSIPLTRRWWPRW